ncbi:MAG: glycosyltransferase [Litorimonas sp.]
MRILFISRHYPPHVSGGSRRAYEFVQGLRDSGEHVTIACPNAGKDPHAIHIHHPQPEASTKPAKPSWKDTLRTHLLYPDPDILWSLRAVKAIKKANPKGFDCIITTSPPESVHVAGFLLKREWGCHWIADFRDSWLEVPLYPIRHKWYRKWIEAKIARLILKKSDLRITTLQSYSDEVKSLSTLEAHTLPNFAPEPKSVDISYALNPDHIHVMHTGSFSLSDLGRSIAPVLEAFTKAREQNEKLQLHLIGRLTDEEILQVQASPAHAYVHIAGIFNYNETRLIQNQAHALIVTAAPGAIAIPGKIEEYKSANRPIIAVGDGPWKKGLNPESPISQLSSLTHEKRRVSYDLVKSDDIIARLKSLMEQI